MFEKFGVTRLEGILDNGVRVVLFHRPNAPIYTTALLHSGSLYDPEQNPGLAHFLEHMIVNGSKEFPSKDLLAEHIESAGGIYGAFTTQDVQAVHTEVSDKSDYEKVIDIFTATLAKPLMDKDVFENEKKVVIKEIQRYNSEPLRLLSRVSRKLFFNDTPLEHDITGDEQSILGLVYEEAIFEYKKMFDASRMLFIASGDISIEELVTHLNKVTVMKGQPFIEKDQTVEVKNEYKILSTFFDAPQTHIALGVPSAPPFSKESIHLNLLGTILIGGRASRLMKRLRYKKGLVYGGGMSKIGSTHTGAWRIVTDTTESHVQEVVDEILGEIKDLLKDGVTERELDFVKNKKIKSLKRTMQTSADWVDFHLLPEAFGENYTLDTFVKYITETTNDDILSTARTYLHKDNWKLALCGRTKDIDIKLHW